MIVPNFDLEREPLQQGYPLNIGDIVEVDLSDNPKFSVRKAVATIYSVGGGFFSLVAHDVIHGNMDYMGGHGLSWPMYNEDLSSKIKKITMMINELSVVGGRKADEAMNVDEVIRGGIDLNAKNMGLDVTKDGNGVEIKFDPAMVAEFQQGDFSGIVPVIIRITPIDNVLPILGLQVNS